MRHPMPHKWEPRVPAWKIRRLYESDAQGLLDEELLEDVGSSLVARGHSFLIGNKAMLGTITCLQCGSEIRRVDGDKAREYSCECGWRITWGDYQLKYRKHQLTGMSVGGMVEEYIDAWSTAETTPAKMRAVDTLLHRFHWQLSRQPTRPLAVNFIDLRLNECVRLILDLAYGRDSIASREEHDRWLANARRAGYYAEIVGTS